MARLSSKPRNRLFSVQHGHLMLTVRIKNRDRARNIWRFSIERWTERSIVRSPMPPYSGRRRKGLPVGGADARVCVLHHSATHPHPTAAKLPLVYMQSSLVCSVDVDWPLTVVQAPVNSREVVGYGSWNQSATIDGVDEAVDGEEGVVKRT